MSIIDTALATTVAWDSFTKLPSESGRLTHNHPTLLRQSPLRRYPLPRHTQRHPHLCTNPKTERLR